MSAPNIVNIANLYGNTALLAISNTATAVANNVTGSNSVLKMNTLMVTTTLSVTANVSVDIFRTTANTAYPLANNISIPASSTLVLIGKDTPIYLQEGDALRVFSPNANVAANTMFATASYDVIS